MLSLETLQAAVAFLAMLSLLVAVHEYGHYIVARLFKMGVEEFAIGFGRKTLVTWLRRTYQVKLTEAQAAREARKAAEETGESAAGVPRPTTLTEETVFTVRPIPLGGFVRIKGMIPEEDGSEIHVPGGFYSRPPWQRFLVLLAGPAFSVLAGMALLVTVYTAYGIERPRKDAVLGPIGEGSPAAAAGLKSGDRVLSVDGKPVNLYFELVAAVRDTGGKPVTLVVERQGERRVVTATPKLDAKPTEVLSPELEPTGEKRIQAKLGIGLASVSERLPFGAALAQSAAAPVELVKGIAGMVKKPSTIEENVGGPATIADLTARMAKRGMRYLMFLAAMLSISLGVFNLLPIPPLDGGQMLVALAEMLRGGRRLSFKVQTAISTIGLSLVAMLILGVFFIDIKRYTFGRADNKPPVSSSESK